MKIINHCAYRFLKDPTFLKEMMQTQGQMVKRAIANKEMDAEGLMFGMELFYYIASPHEAKNYIVSQTVLNNLSLFDAKKAMTLEGWKVFKHLPSFKKTFILAPKQGQTETTCIRVVKTKTSIHFLHLTFTPDKHATIKHWAQAYWVSFWVDFANGEISTNFSEKDVEERAPFIYSLLCFTELTQNTEVIIPAGQRYGTAKTFKTQNIFSFPLTLINSNWNITTIKGGGFPVRGHAAIYWTGPGKALPQLIYRAPYEKTGYTRKAGKLLDK